MSESTDYTASKNIVTRDASPTARALMSLMGAELPLAPERPPVVAFPEKPEGYTEVKEGLDRMAAHFADPARQEVRRTDVSDVARELGEVIAKVARSGVRLDLLPLVLEYDDAVIAAWSKVSQWDRYAQGGFDKAVTVVTEFLGDIAAVRTMQEVVGADVLADAYAAPNKTLAAVSLDLAVREQRNAGGAAELPITQAGRGLMALRQIDVQPASLTLEDLEEAAALALLEAMPAPVVGGLHPINRASVRFAGVTLEVSGTAVVSIRNARTPHENQRMLPHSVVAAVSEAAMLEAQQAVAERQGAVSHQFVGESSASMDRYRLRSAMSAAQSA